MTTVEVLKDVLSRARFGWMDSTDFMFEVGQALGGSTIYPSAANCRECLDHIERDTPDPDDPTDCYPKEVAVVDADWLRSLVELASAPH